MSIICWQTLSVMVKYTQSYGQIYLVIYKCRLCVVKLYRSYDQLLGRKKISLLNIGIVCTFAHLHNEQKISLDKVSLHDRSYDRHNRKA